MHVVLIKTLNVFKNTSLSSSIIFSTRRTLRPPLFQSQVVSTSKPQLKTLNPKRSRSKDEIGQEFRRMVEI